MLIYNLVGSGGFHSETCQIVRVSGFVFPNQVLEKDTGQKINAPNYTDYQKWMYTLKYAYNDNNGDGKQIHAKLYGS